MLPVMSITMETWHARRHDDTLGYRAYVRGVAPGNRCPWQPLLRQGYRMVIAGVTMVTCQRRVACVVKRPVIGVTSSYNLGGKLIKVNVIITP